MSAALLIGDPTLQRIFHCSSANVVTEYMGVDGPRVDPMRTISVIIQQMCCYTADVLLHTRYNT